MTRAPALADDRAAHARRAGPARRWSTACRSRAPSAPTRCRSPRSATNPAHLQLLEAVDAQLPARGAVRRRRAGCSAELAGAGARGRAADGRQPARQRRRCCCATSSCPTSATTPSTVPRPGGEPPRRPGCSGRFLRDVIARQRRDELPPRSGPTRPPPTGWRPCSRSTDRRLGRPRRIAGDDHLAPDGRVMEVLSEHLCQGWLEGYLLTGRHGLFNCYEAFIHIVDSMFNQHAKWLKTTREIPWRRPIASLNYLLSSHVWRQDHNGFSHQDPGFIDHVVNKKAEVVRVYLPPDANSLLSVADHCLRSRNYVNVIVAGKQPALDWLDMDEAIVHCTRGARHLGVGLQRRRASSPTSCWPAPATCRRSRRWRRRRSCARASARPEGPRRQRRRPDAPAADDRASARAARPRVRRPVHDRPAGDLRLPRLPAG